MDASGKHTASEEEGDASGGELGREECQESGDGTEKSASGDHETHISREAEKNSEKVGKSENKRGLKRR